MIDHIGFEVSDLRRSARFYDAVFFALGARRMHSTEHAIAYGHDGPLVWIVVRGRAPAAAHAAGLANGGADDGAPGQRPQYGKGYYAAYLRDPDGLRVEFVSHR